MQWEVVIGFETHVQLNTQAKIFSGTATQFGQAPNTQASPVDLALPGTLPVLNRAAVEKAIQFGLAVGAHISPASVFARKNYFYPDLPKGYQISQFEYPIVVGGGISFALEENGQSTIHTVPLTRAHLEEDAGKSLHQDYHGMSGIDLNRAGTPLLEIVTEPVMRSAKEAVAYAKALHALVIWLDICDGNMQEGSFRCDANVSVRPLGQTTLGTRCEIKNLNSFRFLEEAITSEIARQIACIEDGGKIIQETRLYDPDTKETRAMRSKEDAHDYRYFPDPDLLPLVIDPNWITSIQQSMPTLPAAKRTAFTQTLGLSDYNAMLLTQTKWMADYFEKVVAKVGSTHAKLVANWVTGEVASLYNRSLVATHTLPVTEAQLACLLTRIVDQTISKKIAKDIFYTMWETPTQEDDYADSIILKEGLKQVSDPRALETLIDAVLSAHPTLITEYQSGKQKAFHALVGQVMKQSQGKANPVDVNTMLTEKLGQQKNAH